MIFKKFFAERKEKANARRLIDSQLTNKMYLEVSRGSNHIFTPYFLIGKHKDGYAYINNTHKVKVISCSEYSEISVGKSATKKLGGAVVGGLLTGGAGAIVGSMVTGNNKKTKEKFDILRVMDENGNIHEVGLKYKMGQRILINSKYLGG